MTDLVAATSPTPAVLLERPLARPGLTVHEPDGADQHDRPDRPWVVEMPDGHYVRLGRDAARLLQVLDGSRSPTAVAEELGAPWDADLVEATLARLAGGGLVVDAADRDATGHGPSGARAAGRRRWGRLEYRAPASLQLTLVDPSRWLARHEELLRRWLTSPVAVWLAVLLGAAGALSLAAQGAAVADVLSTPVSLSTVVVVFAGFVTATSLHELAHAATLAGFGGRPRRLGVMLFYFSPACFCDVSDAWRLDDRRQRVWVALAGGLANLAVAGALGLASPLVGGSWRAGFLLLALSCLISAVVNLVPLVKFDGYIAVMSALDLPYLRDKAMADWRATTARVVLGARRVTRQLPDKRWAPLYGAGCALMPLLMVGLAVHRLDQMTAGWGRVGGIVRLAVAALVLRFLGRRLLLLVRTAREGRASPGRIAGGLLLAGVVAAVGLLTVRVPEVVEAGYVMSDDGTAMVVVRSPRDADRLDGTAIVELQRQGPLLRRTVGEARIVGPPTTVTVPAQALAPMVRSTNPVEATALTLGPPDWTSRDHDVVGAATVEVGQVRLGPWLADHLVVDPIETLFG
jgi:putative peptide zinc metalloprotease protein